MNNSILLMLAPFLFQAKTYGHLPKIKSRRFWGIDQQGYAAYKTDGDTKEIQTSADLLKELNEIKTGLEATMETKADARFDEKIKAVNQAIEDLKSVKPEVTAAELKAIKDDLAAVIRQADMIDINVKRQGKQAPQEAKSFDQQLKEALEKHTDDIEKMARKDNGRKDFVIELKAVGDVSVANYTGGTRGLTAIRSGIIVAPNRKTHLRDILPTGNLGPGTEYVFMRENGPGEGAIAPVAEGALKPQIDLDLVEASVKIETIAGWMRVTRKAMNNIPGFISFIQNKLPEKLLNVEDAQILSGDGVSPNLKGILTAGNFTAATGAGTIDIEQLVQAISQLEELEREATGIVVRPSDYYNLLLNKAVGSGEYNLPAIITVDASGTLRVLGIPVVHTTAMTVDKFIVGDFRQGAQLLIQEGMKLEFFEQDGTNVRENKVTIRIEETVALPVFGTDYFIYGDFGNVA